MILAHAALILIALAVIRSLIFRRNLMTPIGERQYRGGWKLAGIVILYILQATLVTYASGKTNLQMLILAFSHIGLMILLLQNRHIPGVKLVLLSAFLNIVVVLANGGFMPVTPEIHNNFVHPERPPAEVGVRPPNSKNVILDKENTNLWLLSDIIRITVPWRRTAISIGDVLLVVGAAQFIFQVKAPPRTRTRKAWVYDGRCAGRYNSSRPAPVFVSPVAWQIH